MGGFLVVNVQWVGLLLAGRELDGDIRTSKSNKDSCSMLEMFVLEVSQ